jgi:hypothetical protein
VQLSDILSQTGGLRSIARELSIDEDDAARAAEALGPAVLGGFRKQVEANPMGIEGLGGLLNRFGGGGLLDSVLSSKPTDTASGNSVLGHIFGSKEVSRAVAENAAAKTGQDPSVLRKMLPMLAMLVGGYMAKQRAEGSPRFSADGGAGIGGTIGGMPRDQNAGDDPDGLGGLLNMGGKGNPLDEIVGRLGR